MKKTILLIAALFITGCGGGSSPYDRLELVAMEFTLPVELSPVSHNQFVIRDNEGSVWYVETRYFNGKITIYDKHKVFKPFEKEKKL